MQHTGELKDSKKLIADIQAQYPKLSKGQKLIAQYILTDNNQQDNI